MGGLVAVDLFHVARELHEFYSLAGTLAHQLVTPETSDASEASDDESNSETDDLSFIEFARSNLATRLRHLNLALNEGATREFQCNERIREFLSYLHFYLNQHFRIHVSEDPDVDDRLVFGTEEIEHGCDLPRFVGRSSRRGQGFCSCRTRSNCVERIPEFALHIEELQIQAEAEMERLRVAARSRVKPLLSAKAVDGQEPGEVASPPAASSKRKPSGKTKADSGQTIGPPEEIAFYVSRQEKKIIYAMWGGQIVTRDELRKAAWPKSSDITPRSVHDAVYSLAEKLEERRVKKLGIKLEISKGRNKTYRLIYEPPAASDAG